MRVLTFLAVLITAASGFQSSFVPTATAKKPLLVRPTCSTSTSLEMSLFTAIPRGGADLIAVGAAALQSGPFGVISMWGVASAVVVPLTMIRQGYSFSVGYGFSVMAMGLTLLRAFEPIAPVPLAMVATTIFYGFRLGAFLAIRNASVPSKAEQMKNFDKSPRLQRIPLALGVALFYAFMTIPALYACRAGALQGIPQQISMAGTALAIIGAVMEAIADGHKFWAKRRSYSSNDADFVGPTGGVYQICRHPNYLGELVFWAGLFVGGAPAFGTSVIAWVASAFGLYGIYGIMSNASKRLDAKQAEKYQGQPKYEAWKASVKAELFPFIE
jgi:steroid 5-alpha reductase family enzyme